MIRIARHAISVGLALGFLTGGVGDALGLHHCPHHDAAGGPCTCVGRCQAGAGPSIATPAAAQAAPVAEAAALSIAEP